MRPSSGFLALLALFASTAAQISMTINAPALGVDGPVTGRVTGLPQAASAYKVGILVSGNNGATWWDKTHDYPNGRPQDVVLGIPLNADYTFYITGWVSDPNDLQASLMRVIIVPQSFSFLWPGYQVEGVPYPNFLTTATVASITLNRQNGQITQFPGGAAPAASPAVVPPPAAPAASPVAPAASPAAPTGGGVGLTMTAFPAAGTMNPISGRVSGLTDPTQYKAVLYLQGGGTWWIKPQPGQSFGLAADGSFSIPNWASYPAGDVNFQALQLYIVPIFATVANVLGGGLPATMQSAAVISANFPRGYTPGAASATIVTATPTPVAPVVSPPAAGTVAIRLTSFPARGATTPLVGRVTGLANPAAYKVVIYLQGNTGTWWIKPQPGSATILGADGSFNIANWATSPNDINMLALQLYVVPAISPITSVLGGTLPALLAASAVATANYPAGYLPDGVVAPSPPAASPPAASKAASPAASAAGGSTPAIAINPIVGGGGAITGKVSGLKLAASAYKAYVYIGGNGWWGPKPTPATGYNLNTDYTFVITNWASDPNDYNQNTFMLYILPAASAPPAILGAAAIPAALTTAAVVSTPFSLAGAGGGGVVIPTTPPTGGAGELTWPPGPPGAKTGGANGFINFAGYRWIVKNSNWGRVGPGNNMFSPSVDHIWTDNWGLHFNIMPTQGCGNWVSTEVWMDHSLGYGTYLFRTLAPVDTLDPDVTWSPFFLWDDSAGAYNGFREIDFEIARWGDAGDPTSSQFVLRPLQSGPMVPGWKIRYLTKNMDVYSGSGQGSGGCNDPGQDNFNGAAVSKVTCALRWFPGKLSWYCAQGFWTLNTFNNIPQNRLLSTYTYAYPNYVPDPGDNRVHFNLWLQNGAQPRWGRRVHTVIAGFEYNNQDLGFNNLPANLNIAQRSLLQADSDIPQHFDSAGRLLQTTAGDSCGDPTGDGMKATISMLSVPEGDTVQGQSFDPYAYQNQPTGSRVLAEAGSSGEAGWHPSPAMIAGTVAAGLVALSAMFAAGFTAARYRPNLIPALSAQLVHDVGADDIPGDTRTSRVAPVRSRTTSRG